MPTRRSRSVDALPVLMEPDQRPLIAVAADDGLNLRAGASPQAAVLRTLPQGSMLCAREPLSALAPKIGTGVWISVCALDGVAGFVWAEYVTLTAGT